jgi:hypothetical protein
MSRNKTLIPNPNKITAKELEFIQNNENTPNLISNVTPNTPPTKEKKKGRMISMSDSFCSTLDTYLEQNPTEGSKASFIVRVVAEYIKSKTNN